MGIKLEYKGFTFEFKKIPSSEQLEQAYNERIAALKAASQRLKASQIKPADRDEPLPTTSLQERFWYMHLASGGGVALHISHIVWLGGAFDRDALETAFGIVVDRHEILRTAFQRTASGLTHVVDHGVRFRVDSVDARQAYAAGGQENLHATIKQIVDEPFDLERPPLIRCTVLDLAPSRYALVMVMHHIAGDGWSLRLLLQEVLASYQTAVTGKGIELPDLPIQFADFAAWQRKQRTEDRNAASAVQYWVDQLLDSEALELPTDHARPATRSHHGATYRFDLDAGWAAALREFVSDRQDVTLFHVLLGAFQIVLGRYSGSQDVSVGSVVSGRNRPEVENVIGCFINNMVLRTSLRGAPDVDEFLGRVSTTVKDAQANEVPFDWIVDALRNTRNIQEKPLFRVMLIQDEFPNMAGEVAGLELLGSEPWYPGAHYDMTLFVEAGEETIAFVFRYATELFDESTIARIADSYLRILRQFVLRPDLTVCDLTIVDDSVTREIVQQWSVGPEVALDARPVHKQFEDRVTAHPDRVALSFGGGQWTYEELNRRANLVAAALIERGVGPDVLVGVSIERSPALLATLLGVLKAGGAYVALQTDLPEERYRYMAQDAGAEILVCSRAGAELPWDGERLRVETILSSDAPATDPTGIEIDPDHLAYVLYTSGSTGRPKGVEMRHGGVSNLVAALQHRGLFDADSVVLWKTPYGFDVSVSEMYNTLVAGGRLVVTESGAEKDPSALIGRIRDEAVNTLRMVPTALHLLTDDPGFATCDTVHTVICAGEALTSEMATQYFGRVDGELYNLLGATETCVDTTYQRCTADGAAVVAVGGPLENYTTYVLDDYLQPVAEGFAGQLCVGGAALARAYHDMPARTALSFLPEPFGKPGGRMYATGDVVRWAAPGVMAYVGRADNQLQVRGIRVELGELEAQLQGAPGVGQVAVIPVNEREGRADALIGYLVASGSDEISAPAVRAHLQRFAQDAVIPSQWVVLDEMPRTPSGKIDRSALPAPDQRTRERERVAPRDDTERTLAGLWAEALEVDEIGVHENFFEIGGHSVTAIQIIARAKERGLLLRPLQFFQHPTVARLARVVEEVAPLAPQEATMGDAALTNLQRSLLARDGDSPAVAVLFRVTESTNAEQVGTALTAVTNHHDALRLQFRKEGDHWRQTYGPVLDGPFDVAVCEVDGQTDDIVRSESQRLAASLNIESGPLVAATLLQSSEEMHLLVAMHELVSDPYSWTILAHDLGRAIRSAAHDRKPAFAPKTYSFGSWSERATGRSVGSPPANAPSPLPLGSVTHRRGRVVEVLAVEEAQAVFDSAYDALNLTPREVVTTALAAVLSDWASTSDPTLVVADDGRAVEEIVDGLDTSRTIGNFAGQFPLQVHVPTQDWPEAASLRTKEDLRAVMDAGLGSSTPVEPGLLLRYWGALDTQMPDAGSSDPLLVPTDVYSTGRSVLVDAFTINGALHLVWSYDGGLLADTEAQRRAAQVLEKLGALRSHFESVEDGRFTASDFAGVDADDFAQLASLLGDD